MQEINPSLWRHTSSDLIVLSISFAVQSHILYLRFHGMATTILKSFYAKNRKVWRQWLQKNHSKEPGVWLIYYKKSSGKNRVLYNEAVEEALCFGWIDSIVKPIDDEKYMQKFTPRKVKSVWSALNKRRVEKLIEEKLMMPAGMKIIDIAKQNGSWIKLDDVENHKIPDDLKKVFIKNKDLQKWFEGLANSQRKQWLYKLYNARLPETRAKRIEELVKHNQIRSNIAKIKKE